MFLVESLTVVEKKSRDLGVKSSIPISDNQKLCEKRLDLMDQKVKSLKSWPSLVVLINWSHLYLENWWMLSMLLTFLVN